jgi:hypothetical protein
VAAVSAAAAAAAAAVAAGGDYVPVTGNAWGTCDVCRCVHAVLLVQNTAGSCADWCGLDLHSLGAVEPNINCCKYWLPHVGACGPNFLLRVCCHNQVDLANEPRLPCCCCCCPDLSGRRSQTCAAAAATGGCMHCAACLLPSHPLTALRTHTGPAPAAVQSTRCGSTGSAGLALSA